MKPLATLLCFTHEGQPAGGSARVGVKRMKESRTHSSLDVDSTRSSCAAFYERDVAPTSEARTVNCRLSVLNEAFYYYRSPNPSVSGATSCSIGPVEFNPHEVSIRRNLPGSPRWPCAGRLAPIAARARARLDEASPLRGAGARAHAISCSGRRHGFMPLEYRFTPRAAAARSRPPRAARSGRTARRSVTDE